MALVRHALKVILPDNKKINRFRLNISNYMAYPVHATAMRATTKHNICFSTCRIFRVRSRNKVFCNLVFLAYKALQNKRSMLNSG